MVEWQENSELLAVMDSQLAMSPLSMSLKLGAFQFSSVLFFLVGLIICFFLRHMVPYDQPEAAFVSLSMVLLFIPDCIS